MTSPTYLQAIYLSKYILFHSRLLSWACEPSEPLLALPEDSVSLAVGRPCRLASSDSCVHPFPGGLVQWEVRMGEGGGALGSCTESFSPQWSHHCPAGALRSSLPSGDSRPWSSHLLPLWLGSWRGFLMVLRSGQPCCNPSERLLFFRLDPH